MSNSVTDAVKERLSIEEVVSSYIKLEKSGINLRARCPFHNEKTPSFFVSPDRGSFYCFGCSKGGDIFSFVQEIEGVDFKEALKILAEKAGLDISEYKFESSEKVDDSLYSILEKATLYFERNLQQNSKSKEYISSRGIKENISSRFRIGYAKDEWQSLYDHLKDQKYSDSQILKTGLVIKNDKGRVYDRFRGRVIFPIFDDRGRVVAYSARILTDEKDQPKYINSPETSLFNKSKTLYGFNFSKQTIRKYDFAILVEGQMDVILAHQIGYTNTVASSGTSFTEEQLKIIKRHTNNLLVAFDGDSAGVKSSKKVWEMALSQEMDVKILPLRQGQDPADIILNNADDWKDLVKKSRHIIEHFAENIQENYSDRRKQQKELQKEVYPYIQSLKTFTDKSYFVEKISEMFGIDKDAIWADVNTEKPENPQYQDKKEKKINPKEILFSLYLSKEIKDPDKFLEKIEKLIPKDLFTEMEKRKEKMLFEFDLVRSQYDDIQKLASDMYEKLTIDYLENKKAQMNKKLRDGIENEAEIMKKLVEITKEIENVKKKGCQDLLDVI